MTRRKSGHDGNPRLDPVQVEYYRYAREMSVKDLKNAAGIADETWRHVMRGERIWMDSAVNIRKALGVDSLLTLLHPATLAEITSAERSARADDGELPDWEADTPASGLVEVANGLKYHVWRLRHRLEANQFARGKRYDLSLLPTAEQDRMHAYLARHADVCNRVADNPLFPKHLTTTPARNGDAYWVIDEWIPGKTLAEMLLKGPFAKTLREARETIIAAREMNVFPPPARATGFCSNCRWGAPHVHRRGRKFLRHGQPIELRLVPAANRKKVHSHCGDRFQWLPPHNGANRLGLKV